MDYVKGILEGFIAETKEHRKETDKTLREILVQTTTTNGKVAEQEKKIEAALQDINNLKAYRSENKGRDKIIGVALGAAGAVVLIFISWFLSKH